MKSSINLSCKNCHEPLVGNYTKVFCSIKCSNSYRFRNRPPIVCKFCSKELRTRWKSHIKRCEMLEQQQHSSVCSFGCQRPAKYFFKNGKSCCSKGTGPCFAYQRSKLSNEKYNEWVSNIKRHKKPAWNKGLGIEDSRIRKGVEKIRQNGGYVITDDMKKRLSKIAKEKGCGGYREGGGRGKKGWYKGIYCDSSWELAFVIYHLDMKHNIKRCKEIRSYIWENKIKNYYPDFDIDGKIYEIKGYKSDKWAAKLEANPDIICLYKDDIKPYIDYVIEQYGKDFIRLYE